MSLSIKEIFYSGTHSFIGSIDTLNEISFLIEHGYLRQSEIHMAHKNEYLALLRDTKTIAMNAEADGGGAQHIVLKLLGGKYLHDKRGLDFEYEHPFCGYFPDVISKDKLIVIECGQTSNPEKMYSYFVQGKITECIQFPYPSEVDEILLGYSFTPGKDLHEFLIDLEATKRSELKEIRNLINRH